MSELVFLGDFMRERRGAFAEHSLIAGDPRGAEAAVLARLMHNGLGDIKPVDWVPGGSSHPAAFPWPADRSPADVLQSHAAGKGPPVRYRRRDLERLLIGEPIDTVTDYCHRPAVRRLAQIMLIAEREDGSLPAIGDKRKAPNWQAQDTLMGAVAKALPGVSRTQAEVIAKALSALHKAGS